MIVQDNIELIIRHSKYPYDDPLDYPVTFCFLPYHEYTRVLNESSFFSKEVKSDCP
jgi:hypothetical protein